MPSRLTAVRGHFRSTPAKTAEYVAKHDELRICVMVRELELAVEEDVRHEAAVISWRAAQ